MSVSHAPWRARLHEIIFEADTAAGRAFDVALLWAIVLSVQVVMLDSVAAVRTRWVLAEGDDSDARYCKRCGASLSGEATATPQR